MSHYFTNEKNLKPEKNCFMVKIKEQELSFITGAGIFSKKRLDLGTRLLLESFSDNNYKTVLEVGTGWGPISIYLKKEYPAYLIDAIDINLNALKYASDNAKINKVKINFFESDFFKNVKNKYDLIISNPPIRIGKEKLYDFYLKSKKYLTSNGELLIVVAKDKGALSTIKYLNTIFKDVKKIIKKKGYVVIKAKNN